MLTNRWLLAAVALPALAGMALAQTPPKPAAPRPAASQPKQPSQEELVKLRDEKLALPVFKKANWTFDYDAARAEAKKSGKPIFTYFSRSYAH
jgi:hypothetical protein